MRESSESSSVIKAVGHPVAGGLTALLTWLTAGQSGAVSQLWASVLGLVGGVSALAFSLLYGRYSGILASGNKRKTSLERQAYDRLRKSLAEGNGAARLYADWLGIFLDWIEKFFGDAGMADRTLFPHAFGLKKPAPLWTAPAFDRCLLLALIYPIATIFIIWATTGHVGPAEAALDLKPDIPGWRRGLAVAAIGISIFAAWRYAQTKGGKRRIFSTVAALIFIVAGAVAPTVAFAFAGAGAGAGAVAGAFAVAVAVFVAFAVAVAFPFAGAVAGAFAVAVAVFVAFAFAGPFPFAVVVAFAVALAAIAVLGQIAIERGWQGPFLAVYLLAGIAACFVAAPFLAPLETWKEAGPVLLFLGLLTLLNAPVDWLSLGLTRALLRRGVELGGWCPFGLALLDALFAPGFIAALALVMVFSYRLSTNSRSMAAARRCCLWASSLTALPRTRRRRNFGGSMRFCS